MNSKETTCIGHGKDFVIEKEEAPIAFEGARSSPPAAPPLQNVGSFAGEVRAWREAEDRRKAEEALKERALLDGTDPDAITFEVTEEGKRLLAEDALAQDPNERRREPRPEEAPERIEIDGIILERIDADFADPVRKDTNPKDAIGIRKAPISTVPGAVVMEIGLGLLEGACKYRRHNYRSVGVRASVYYDACFRHLVAWWEGENTDPDSGLPHIAKLLSSGAVLRDAQLQGMLVDDRPPPSPIGWLSELNAMAGRIINRYPDPKPAYTRDDVAKRRKPEQSKGPEGK